MSDMTCKRVQLQKADVVVSAPWTDHLPRNPPNILNTANSLQINMVIYLNQNEIYTNQLNSTKPDFWDHLI